jgi:hypothetical protein
MQMIALTMLAQSEVRAVRERYSREPAARAAAARCFESPSQRARGLCGEGVSGGGGKH